MSFQIHLKADNSIVVNFLKVKRVRPIETLNDIPRTGRVYYLPVSEPGEPTISMRQYHYRETNLPNLRSWRDGRRHRHAQFPARQQVCPKDAPARPPFRPDAARLTQC